jgi:hypothetical protein
VGVQHFVDKTSMKDFYERDKEHFHYTLGALLSR